MVDEAVLGATASLRVVVYSVMNSSSKSVVMRKVVMASVMFAAKVSIIICDSPCNVVEMLTDVVRVADSVSRAVCHTSYWRIHSVVPLAYPAQTFSATSVGASPAVTACQGARKYVVRRWTVGAAVIAGADEVATADTLAKVVGADVAAELEAPTAERSIDSVGLARTNPYSVEKVMSCEHLETVYFCTSPVKVVAQTMVTVGS